MFTLVFARRAHSELELARMKRRRSRLIVLDVVATVYAVIMCLEFHSIVATFILGNMACLFYWFMALTSLLSMRHIHKCQKPLESMGIYASSWTMRFYIILWVCLATSYTIIITLTFAIELGD